MAQFWMIAFASLIGLAACSPSGGPPPATPQPVLVAESFKPHVEFFNEMIDEAVVNHVPNAQAWAWLEANIPLFEAPDADFERVYYYRWWTFRKHLKKTPDGFVFTEFIRPVGHARDRKCVFGFRRAHPRGGAERGSSWPALVARSPLRVRRGPPGGDGSG